MPFAATELTQVMGLGHYVGEVRQGPGGQLYKWVQGVDGLGNPIGLPKWLNLKRLARAALPYTKFMGPAAFAAGTLAQRSGLLGTSGIGQIAQGPDGQLYEWVEGVDGLGHPIGFLKRLKKRLGRAASGVLQRALPMASQLMPGAGALLPAATNLLQQGGGASTGDEVMAGPGGQLYEVVEGIGEDGTVRRAARPIRLCIAATIRPGHVRQGARPVVPTASTVPAMQPVAPVQRMAPARRRVPVRRFR
jgi:hypothetical protein